MSLDRPLVSVCIPAYNSEKYLGETINCILNQSYDNIEIIVVDDGSTDKTETLLNGIQDKRFKYIIQSNKGAAGARNTAYRLSTGEFIKFMDADDLINPDCIRNQVQRIIDKPDCIASAKWGRFFAEDAADLKLVPEKVWKDSPGIEWLVDSLIDSGSNMVQPGIFLIPRNIIDKAGPWNETLSLIDDFEFMVRILSISKQVFFCEAAVLMYRSGIPDNLSGKKSANHMQSAFDSLALGTKRILEIKNDSRSRLACANAFQKWAYEFYQYHPGLCSSAEQQIKQLGGSTINMGGSKMYILLSKLIGWKRAKGLKMYLMGNA